MVYLKPLLVSHALLAATYSSEAFSLSGTRGTVQTSALSAVKINEEDSLAAQDNRRRMLKACGLALLTPAIVPRQALADVSDGNALPQGAAQFQRVIRAKSDMIAVIKRVSESASEMDKTEWNNVGQFLRKVYAVSEDMKAIASGFYDPAKKKRASELIDDIKKVSKAADAPTGSQNGPEFLVYAKKITSILDEFLDLLRDVPDEL